MQEQHVATGYSRQVRLGRDELATWRAFLRAHAVLTRRLERELAHAGRLTLSELDVLVTLFEAPEGSLRLSDLAERVMLTKSGMTRLLDRIESDGLIERLPCEADRRGQFARLTVAGRRALRRSTGTHLRFVKRAFADPVGSAARPSFRAALERLAAR